MSDPHAPAKYGTNGVVRNMDAWYTAFHVEPMASTLAQLAIVQLLFLAYLEQAGEAAQERLARTQSALESRHVKGRLR